MAYITDYQYYENGGNNPSDANWGSYQYVTLRDIVTNFQMMYSGNHELVNNVERYKIIFHAKRAIQELNYDAMKEIKVLELNVCDDLRFVLPPDFVNWVRISIFEDGILRPLKENQYTNYAASYLQDNDCNVLFDEDGNVIKAEFSHVDLQRLSGTLKSTYFSDNEEHPYNGVDGWYVDGMWYFDFAVGKRFGLNTESAAVGPTFSIDKRSGVINFSSYMAGQLCVLEYVSDGMEKGNDLDISVNKMFEEYVYAYIEYQILRSKLGVQEYIVRRKQKAKEALLRNAKIRISNIHPSRLLMPLRGQDKWIK
jgi:hypothetical protein